MRDQILFNRALLMAASEVCAETARLRESILCDRLQRALSINRNPLTAYRLAVLAREQTRPVTSVARS